MNILIDLNDFGCKGHTFSLADVEIVLPEGELPVMVKAGTEILLTHNRACPVCSRRFYSIEFSEDFAIWPDNWPLVDEGETAADGPGGQASQFLQGNANDAAIEPMSDEEIDAIEADAEANPGPPISPERDQRQRAFMQQLVLGYFHGNEGRQ